MRHRRPRHSDPIAIATAGLIDSDTGIITSANINSIHGRRLSYDLEQSLDRSVALINDADAFVLAESTFGIARDHSRVLGIILGTGVGGGLIEDGKIITGPGGVGGEWGHGQVVASSPRTRGATPVFACGCGGWGCLDTIGGARGMERLHKFLNGKVASSRELIDLWNMGDTDAAATIDFYCDLVAGPLAMLINAFPASIVPVGGGLSSSTRLIVELDHRVRKQMLRSGPDALLRSTTLGGDAGLLGAFLAGRNRRQKS